MEQEQTTGWIRSRMDRRILAAATLGPILLGFIHLGWLQIAATWTAHLMMQYYVWPYSILMSYLTALALFHCFRNPLIDRNSVWHLTLLLVVFAIPYVTTILVNVDFRNDFWGVLSDLRRLREVHLSAGLHLWAALTFGWLLRMLLPIRLTIVSDSQPLEQNSSALGGLLLFVVPTAVFFAVVRWMTAFSTWNEFSYEQTFAIFALWGLETSVPVIAVLVCWDRSVLVHAIVSFVSAVAIAVGCHLLTELSQGLRYPVGWNLIVRDAAITVPFIVLASMTMKWKGYRNVSRSRADRQAKC